MAMEITNSCNSYAAQSMVESSGAGSTKKKEAAGNSRSNSTAEYVNELAKLVPSVDLKVGNTFASAKSGKTLTINPQLLEKIQSDPEKEKEMKELIRGVETAVNLLDSTMNASGWRVVFKHGYIDENGKYRQIALVRNDFMLNMSDKLREERRQNAEKLLEKQKEKAAEKKEDLEEMLEEKSVDSKDGMVYLHDTDIEKILEDAKEEGTEKTNTKKATQVGANLDLQI